MFPQLLEVNVEMESSKLARTVIVEENLAVQTMPAAMQPRASSSPMQSVILATKTVVLPPVSFLEMVRFAVLVLGVVIPKRFAVVLPPLVQKMQLHQMVRPLSQYREQHTNYI